MQAVLLVHHDVFGRGEVGHHGTLPRAHLPTYNTRHRLVEYTCIYPDKSVYVEGLTSTGSTGRTRHSTRIFPTHTRWADERDATGVDASASPCQRPISEHRYRHIRVRTLELEQLVVDELALAVLGPVQLQRLGTLLHHTHTFQSQCVQISNRHAFKSREASQWPTLPTRRAQRTCRAASAFSPRHSYTLLLFCVPSAPPRPARPWTRASPPPHAPLFTRDTDSEERQGEDKKAV